MQRRQFTFWLSFGLFTLGERARVSGFDRLAAAAMELTDPNGGPSSATRAVHWTPAQNRSWRWFERETLVDGRWMLDGITTPIHIETGERFNGATGYLDESLVPAAVRATVPIVAPKVDAEGSIEPEPHMPDAARRARHGQPPSRWLRSLRAAEIRIWLKTIEVPEVGVSGMTYWTHLTRDHSFDAEKIAGLTMDEQAKLHAAAHYGY